MGGKRISKPASNFLPNLYVTAMRRRLNESNIKTVIVSAISEAEAIDRLNKEHPDWRVSLIKEAPL